MSNLRQQCKARRTKKKKQTTFFKILYTFAAAKMGWSFPLLIFLAGNQICPSKWRY